MYDEGTNNDSPFILYTNAMVNRSSAWAGSKRGFQIKFFYNLGASAPLHIRIVWTATGQFNPWRAINLVNIE